MNMFEQIKELEGKIHNKVVAYVEDFFEKHKDQDYCGTLSRECIEGDNSISDSRLICDDHGFVEMEVCWYNYDYATYEYGEVGFKADYFTED